MFSAVSQNLPLVLTKHGCFPERRNTHDIETAQKNFFDVAAASLEQKDKRSDFGSSCSRSGCALLQEINVAVDAGPKQSVYDDAVMTDEGQSEVETAL